MNLLDDTKPENRFYCCDGSVLRNLRDLEKKLKTISVQAFFHHVTPSRNDFHNWARDVYRDAELAAELLKAKMPFEAAAIVRRHLAKAAKAREEIEKAIDMAKKQRAAKPATAISAKKGRAGKGKRKKHRKPMKKKTAAEKGKLNKKSKRVKRTGKKAAAAKKKGNIRRKRGKRPANRRIKRQVKKQVKGWLNWLKVIPEL